MKNIPYRYYLPENRMPKAWYNLRADMKDKPEPLINPGTGKPVTPDDLRPVFCDELVAQELDNDTALFPIPQPILDMYRIYRPSPLIRAYRLEQALGTPAHIYYKFEGNNTSGSHKLNSALAQAYYAKAQGMKSLTTETGAGQWGTALAEACAAFGLDLTVFMVKGSYNQKPYRKDVMRTFGAKVIASPSDTTNAGRAILANDPNTTGSLGCAISEAVELAVTTPDCRYVLGSVLNQVLLHQSVIGLESYEALMDFDEYPDVVIGCAGGGSNLGGLMAPFMRDKLSGAKPDTRFVAVEPASCPSLTRGTYAYDFCDTGKITPMAKMYTLGCGFIPSPNHAGGLRYHGMSPMLSKLYHDGYMEAVAYEQTQVFDAATQFARLETILPAPESAHAIRGAIDEIGRASCRERV
jgi:tryptophan synthase beta chain